MLHRLAPVTLALLLGAAGCGSDDDGGVIAGDAPDGGGGAVELGEDGSGATTSTPTDPDTAVSSPPAGDPATSEPVTAGARLVTPTPGLEGVVDSAIHSVVLTGDASLEVRFYGGVEACYGVDEVVVDEAADRVTVTVRTGSRPDAAGTACIELAEFQAVAVDLAAPLGDRAVFDGATGTEVAVP